MAGQHAQAFADQLPIANISAFRETAVTAETLNDSDRTLSADQPC